MRYWSWRWYWDYAGGLMTDIGAHQLDIVQWLGGVDVPKSVVANGGVYHFKHWETPDVIHGVWDYGKFAATFAVEFVNGYDGVGATFYGTKHDARLPTPRAGGRSALYDTIDKPTAEPEAEDGVEGGERDAAARQELGRVREGQQGPEFADRAGPPGHHRGPPGEPGVPHRQEDVLGRRPQKRAGQFGPERRTTD